MPSVAGGLLGVAGRGLRWTGGWGCGCGWGWGGGGGGGGGCGRSGIVSWNGGGGLTGPPPCILEWPFRACLEVKI